ncbi:MAG: aminoacyl-tRNA hydrolase [Ruminococcaceae bacterium]|nr:aminoacyl-tRNA hydrolase [Oscillospiraceae bacterium]
MANIFDLFKQIEKKSSSVGGTIEYMVVGLGNPGSQYTHTRHNAGFLAIDRLAEQYGVKVDRAKFKALVGEATVGGKRVLLMKPQTFMNLSGEAVGEATRFYKLSVDRVIVLSDDITLDVGRLRVRRKGSAGGHNGLKSIQAHLGSDEYPRIKIGVGQKPHADYDLVDWVLSNFSDGELQSLSASFDTLGQGLEAILGADIDRAMQICNGK